MISDYSALHLVQLLSFIVSHSFGKKKAFLLHIFSNFYFSSLQQFILHFIDTFFSILKHRIEEIHAMMKEQSEILKAIGRREGVEDASSNRKSIIGWFLKKY